MPQERDERKESKDPLKNMVPILFLILLVILYLFKEQLPGKPWWAWAIVGFGCIFLVKGAIQSIKPEYRRPGKDSLKTVLIGFFFIFLGNLYLFKEQLSGKPWWAWAIVGFGCILLVEFAIRSTNPKLEIPGKDASKNPVPGLLLILIGSLILFRDQLTRSQWFSWALVGAGCINVVVTVFRIFKPEYKKPDLYKFTLGIVLIVVGAVAVYEFWFLWVLIAFTAGICILALLFHRLKYV
jgi:drug/metabolite transporter (DMT)-like permease